MRLNTSFAKCFLQLLFRLRIMYCTHVMYRKHSSRQSYSQNRRVLYLSLFLCEPMGSREMFHTFSLLVEIEGHFTHEFVSYVYETEDRWDWNLFCEESFCKEKKMWPRPGGENPEICFLNLGNTSVRQIYFPQEGIIYFSVILFSHTFGRGSPIKILHFPCFIRIGNIKHSTV
jgi:hypothetical protein